MTPKFMSKRAAIASVEARLIIVRTLLRKLKLERVAMRRLKRSCSALRVRQRKNVGP